VRIIAIINQKGGCGKTTSAINLAGITAKNGFRTLLVDMDPQSHCAAGLAIPEQRIDLDIGDALIAGGDGPIDAKRLFWRASRNLDLAPSRTKLAGLEAARGGLADKADRERRLSSVLARFEADYDICFIDCPPSIGLLTYNALAAATGVLIPVETSFFSLQGATKQVSTIKSLSKRLGRAAPYWLVATIHDDASVLAKDLLEEMRRRFGKQVAPEVIRRDPVLKEAASFGQPIIEYSPTAPGALDYTALAEWLAAAIGLGEPGRPRQPEPLVADPNESFADLPAMTETPPVQVVGGVESKLAMNTSWSAATGQEVAGIDTATAQAAGTQTASAVETRTAPVEEPRPQVEPTDGVPDGAGLDRAEELAQRTRVMLLKRADEQLKRIAGLHDEAPVMRPDFLNEPKAAVTRESAARAKAEAIRTLYGARTTRSGVLFVQPLSAGQSVAIAGDFNGWAACPMRRNEQLGVYELCLPLPAGRRHYRLVVDGLWTVDPFNAISEPNPFGELNSIIDIAPVKS
jgi:chromosome partitioning protein